MNKKQKNILITVALIIFFMLIYPPWHMTFPEGVSRGYGYSWIFSPPTSRVTVDTGLLLTQWLAVITIGAILFFLSKKS